jgi:preprotein translocase subunit YajC
MPFLLFAQDAAAKQEIPIFLRPEVMLLLIGLFFVAVILPANRRQKKEQAQMMANLKPGSKVVTSSGIIGTVIGLKDGEDELTLRSEDAKLKVLKSSVVRVVVAPDEAKAK